MSKKFKKITKGKFGDIIYPAYNGTSGPFKKPRWDIVVDTWADGTISKRIVTDDYSIIRAIEILMEYPELIGLRKNSGGMYRNQ